MKPIFIFFAFVFVSIASVAQPPGRPSGPGGERIKAMKVGMITQELKLSAAQAEKFWPVYNNFSDERMGIHKEIREISKRNANKGLSNDELLRKQDEIIELKQKDLNLEKRYRETFLKVISTQQYATLMDTERRFNQMLLDKLKERREQD
jgi:hypothetical protein